MLTKRTREFQKTVELERVLSLFGAANIAQQYLMCLVLILAKYFSILFQIHILFGDLKLVLVDRSILQLSSRVFDTYTDYMY